MLYTISLGLAILVSAWLANAVTPPHSPPSLASFLATKRLRTTNGKVPILHHYQSHEDSIPGGSKCSYFYEAAKFTIQEDVSSSRVAVFHNTLLQDYFAELMPFEVVDDIKSPEYIKLETGLHQLWDCINQLSLDNYKITGFNAPDINAFHLSSKRQVNLPHVTVLEMLANIIVNEQNLSETSLALHLLRYAIVMLDSQSPVIPLLMRRLIPTMQLNLTPMDLEDESFKSSKVKACGYPYRKTRNDQEMQHKSLQLLDTFNTGVGIWRNGKSQPLLHPSIYAILPFAFQADNEIILDGILRNIPSFQDDTRTCAEIAAIRKGRFRNQPLNKFPRITQFYNFLATQAGCPALPDQMQLMDLNDDVLREIVSRVDDIQSLARLRSVNSRFKNMVDGPVPGGAACVKFVNGFKLNQTSKQAIFSRRFLTDVLGELIPAGTIITREVSFDFVQVQRGLHGLWECVNQLGRDNYTPVFDDEDIKSFKELSSLRSLPELGYQRTHPMNILVSLMTNAEIVDTSLGTSLIASGTLFPNTLKHLTWNLIPTRKLVRVGQAEPSFTQGHVLRTEFGSLTSEFLIPEGPTIRFFSAIRHQFYHVRDEADMTQKSVALFDAFQKGFTKSILNDLTPDEQNDPMLKLDLFYDIMMYLIPSAFAADNEVVFMNFINPTFLRKCILELELWEFVHTHQLDLMNMAAGTSEESEDEEDEDGGRLNVHNLKRVRNALLSRILDEPQSDRELSDLVLHTFFEKRKWRGFPNIHRWYLSV